MDRAEQPRKNYYTLIPESEDQAKMREYENGARGSILNIVLTHPSINVMKLGRLLYDGAMTNVGFDKGYELYESCVRIHNAEFNEDDYDLVRNGPITILRKDRAKCARMRNYFLLNILACSGYGVFFIQQVGFGNELVESFVEMLRAMIEEDIRRMRIVYLTSKNLTDPLEVEQLKQFRNAYNLGDTVVNIEDLQEDPMGFLLKLRPQYYPNRRLVLEMLKK